MNNNFEDGLALLKQPVLPLVSMVHFLYLTGPFEAITEVIDEMPEPIETAYTLYENPRALLQNHLQDLKALEGLKNGNNPREKVVDATGHPVDTMSAITALISQRILETELERINTALCGPCGCTLCCIGPDETMQQDFFEIPLQEQEIALFQLGRLDTPKSRAHRAMDEPVLQCGGRPFYEMAAPELIRWQTGWSMILPRNGSCPELSTDGRCGVYAQRPQVCRKPQIFGYILEPTEEPDTLRLRSSLLAITDCPYVQALRDNIGAYAAACELKLVLQGNKQ